MQCILNKTIKCSDTHSLSLTGAEQPRVGCIGGDSVRMGSYRPLIGLFTGTHQKLVKNNDK